MSIMLSPWSRTPGARFPDRHLASFDRGFHSPANPVRLAGLLDTPALPVKGYRNRAARGARGRRDLP